MKIFTCTVPDGNEIIQPDIPDASEFLATQVNGVQRGQGWSPIPVRIVRKDDQGRLLKEADTALLGLVSHAIVLKPKAIRLLGPFLLKFGELLPLICQDVELSLFNPTFVLDALDESASILNRFDNGRIFYIKRFAFHHGAIGLVDIFKIPSLRVSPVFFSESAVVEWRNAGVTGLDFKQIWSSEHGVGRANDVSS